METKEFEYKKNPVKAIREKCVNDCCAGDRKEVENCLSPSCPLYPFRFGKNPYRKEKTEEQKQALRERALQNGLGKNTEN